MAFLSRAETAEPAVYPLCLCPSQRRPVKSLHFPTRLLERAVVNFQLLTDAQAHTTPYSMAEVASMLDEEKMPWNHLGMD